MRRPWGGLERATVETTTLEELAGKMLGYRIVPGSFSDLRYALGVPKGRTAAAAYVDEFVGDMIASGAIALFARTSDPCCSWPGNSSM